MRSNSAKPVRQSVTLPPALASEIRRIAEERHLTMSRTLVTLAESGIQADNDAKRQLEALHRRFLDEQEPALKSEAGRDLIRSVFGKDSIAEDSVF